MEYSSWDVVGAWCFPHIQSSQGLLGLSHTEIQHLIMEKSGFYRRVLYVRSKMAEKVVFFTEKVKIIVI